MGWNKKTKAVTLPQPMGLVFNPGLHCAFQASEWKSVCKISEFQYLNDITRIIHGTKGIRSVYVSTGRVAEWMKAPYGTLGTTINEAAEEVNKMVL